ncbi:MFS transporter [Cupriavidus sp. 30B13]|uniref:MFS transporter n=1 Tax=Cupriavidus sp. 30B13 TaxID=3384241 RepID=UPI003B91ADCF
MTFDPKQASGAGPARSEWRAVGAVAAGTFLLVTTEFLPIGLLSRLSADLRISEGIAGLAVTAPGLVAAIVAPVLVLQAGAVDRRLVIAALTAAIVVSNVVAAAAGSFPVFLLGRLILGLAVGGLWTFAVAVGRRLVPASAGARATSIISAGISAGTVFGMPVGAVLGESIGWRATFAANAVLGVLILLAQLRVLPRLAPTTAMDAGGLLAFARIPMARIGLIASGFVAAGHFIAYTFLEPYLRDVLHLGQSGVAFALAGYAVAGIAGAFLGERLAVDNVRRAFIATSALLGAAVLAATAMAGTMAGAIGMVMVWGLAFGAMPVCVQIWMFTSSAGLHEAGSALMVSAFQVSLAAGAAIGGALIDHAGIAAAFAASAVLAFGGAMTALLSRPTPAHAGEVTLHSDIEGTPS